MSKQIQKPQDEFAESILSMRRVNKKTTGGNKTTYSVLIAVGDRNGRVGVGLGNAAEVPMAIKKASAYARKHLVRIAIYNNSIPHEVRIKYRSARLILKPAPEGTGLKLGGVTRVLFDLAGVYNASGKLIGSRNQIACAYATIKAIQSLKQRSQS